MKKKTCYYCEKIAEYECHYDFCKKPLCSKHSGFENECKDCKDKRETRTPGYQLPIHKITINVSDLPVTLTFTPKKIK